MLVIDTNWTNRWNKSAHSLSELIAQSMSSVSIILSGIASVIAYRFIQRKLHELRETIQRNPLSIIYKLIQFVRPNSSLLKAIPQEQPKQKPRFSSKVIIKIIQ